MYRERALTLQEAARLVGDRLADLRKRVDSGDLPSRSDDTGTRVIHPVDLDRHFGIYSTRYGDDVRSVVLPVIAFERGESPPIDV